MKYFNLTFLNNGHAGFKQLIWIDICHLVIITIFTCRNKLLPLLTYSQHMVPCLNCWLPPLVPLVFTYLCQSQINININTRYVCMTLLLESQNRRSQNFLDARHHMFASHFPFVHLIFPGKIGRMPTSPDPYMATCRGNCVILCIFTFPLSHHPLPWRGLRLRVECLACGHIFWSTRSWVLHMVHEGHVRVVKMK